MKKTIKIKRNIVRLIKKRKMAILLAFSILVSASIPILNSFFSWSDGKYFKITLEIIAVNIALFGVLGILMQLNREKKIKEVEFVLSIYNKFIESDSFKKAIEICCKDMNIEISSEYEGLLLEKQDVYRILDFLEPLSIMLQTNSISIDKLYNLIAFRFFIVVNNPRVVEIIKKHNENFVNIVIMFNDLNEYRIRKKRQAPYKDFTVNTDMVKLIESLLWYKYEEIQ